MRQTEGAGRTLPPDINPGVVPISAFKNPFVPLILPAAILAGMLPLPVFAQGRRAPQASVRPVVILDSTREKDGLRGPVRRVRSEVARLRSRGAGVVEGPRRLLEVTVYDAAGGRTENETYPVVGGSAGEESNVYDERGNVAETTQRDARGAVISRTVYSYEFDDYGNWTKMIASLAITGPDRFALEPVEITYRAITYYSSDEPDAPASAVGNDSQPAAEVPSPTPKPAAEIPDVGEMNGKALTLQPPAYPLGRKPKDGPIRVDVKVVVDESGRVVSASAALAPRQLRAAAEAAARGAIFMPFRLGGVPVKVRGTIRYTFPYMP